MTVRDPVARCRAGAGSLDAAAGRAAGPAALVRDRLARFAPEWRRPDGADGVDGVGRAGLLWRVIYGTVAGYRAEIPGLEVVRHEDLSADPVPAFAARYGRLGCRSSPTPSGRSWPRPRPGRAAGDALVGVGRLVSKTAARLGDSRANLQWASASPQRWAASASRSPTSPPSSATPGGTAARRASPRTGAAAHGQHSITNRRSCLSTRTRP